MIALKLPVSFSVKASKGFTIIELVLVIIILAILSATVIPKFLSNKGFSEFSYRSDIISKLRLIQTRAMQQTDTNLGYCRQVLVTNNRLGTPNDCDNTPSFAPGWIADASGVEVLAGDNVTFSVNAIGGFFSFDSMGRPDTCSPCEITIIGENSIKIRIEEEGYIHAL